MSNDQVYLNLQPTEQAIVAAAGQIYAAYVANGQAEKDPEKYLKLASDEAVKLATMVDDKVITSGEMQ